MYDPEFVPGYKKHKNDLHPKLEMVELPISDLRFSAPRLRPLKKKHAERIRQSILRLGNTVPIIVGPDNEVIDGRGRVDVARELGLTSMHCIRVGHLDEQELRLLRLAINKVAEQGTWDPEALRLEFAYHLEFGDDLTLTGFDAPEVDAILQFGDTDGAEAGDDAHDVVEPSGAPVVSRLGDLWQLGKHRLLCGNAREPKVLDVLMAGAVASQILSDPPFNVHISGHVSTVAGKHPEFHEASGEMTPEEFEDFLVVTFSNALTHLREDGLVYLFMDWRHLDELRAALRRLSLEQINLAVWVKLHGGMGSLYRSRHELIFIARRKGETHQNNVELGKHGRNRSNVWEFGGASGGPTSPEDDFSAHATVKPVKLLQEAILDVTTAGDVVLDCFVGSGSTILAAERVHRVCYGLEISPHYVDVAVRRWEQMTGSAAVLEATGGTFAEVAANRMSGGAAAAAVTDTGGGDGQSVEIEPTGGAE